LTLDTVALHPIEQTLARLAEANEHFRLRLLSKRDDKPGWISIADLATIGTPQMAEVLERVASHFKMQDKHAPAAFWLNHYAFAVTAVAGACYLAARRVPSLEPGEVWVRFAKDGDMAAFAWCGRTFTALATDPDASHPDCITLDSAEGLRARLHTQLLDHFTVLLDGLRECTTFGKPGMWAIVADECSSAIAWVGELVGAREAGLAEARAMAAASTKLKRCLDFLHIENCGLDYTMAERSSCCLYYKSESGTAQYCSNCPHRPQEERIQLIKDWLAKRASGESEEHDHDHGEDHND
jgi:hypothetical protein